MIELSAKFLNEHIFTQGDEHFIEFFVLQEPLKSVNGLTPAEAKNKLKTVFKRNSFREDETNTQEYEEFNLTGTDKSYIKLQPCGTEDYTDIVYYSCYLQNIKLTEDDIKVKNEDCEIKHLLFNRCEFDSLFRESKYPGDSFTLEMDTSFSRKDITLQGEASLHAKNSHFRNITIELPKVTNNISIISSEINGELSIRGTYFNQKNQYHLKTSELENPGIRTSLLLKDCYSSFQGAIVLENIKIAPDNRLLLERLSGFKLIQVIEPVFFSDGSSIEINSCDLSSFSLEVIDPTYLKLNNNSWALSKINFFDPIFQSLRTFRKEGFSIPDGIKKAEIKKYAFFQEKRYISLRKEAKESGDKHLEDEFYFSQMYWALKSRFNIHNYLYKAFCGYGLSSFTPILSVVLVFLLFALLYMTVSIFDSVKMNLSIFFLISLSGTIPIFDYWGKFPDKISVFSEVGQFWLYLLLYLERAFQLFFLFETGSAVRNSVKK